MKVEFNCSDCNKGYSLDITDSLAAVCMGLLAVDKVKLKSTLTDREVQPVQQTEHARVWVCGCGCPEESVEDWGELLCAVDQDGVKINGNLVNIKP